MINKMNNTVAFGMNIKNRGLRPKDFSKVSIKLQENPFITLLDRDYVVDIYVGKRELSLICSEKLPKNSSKLDKIINFFGLNNRLMFIKHRIRHNELPSYLGCQDGYWSKKKDEFYLQGTKDDNKVIWCWRSNDKISGDIIKGLKEYISKIEEYLNAKDNSQSLNRRTHITLYRAKKRALNMLNNIKQQLNKERTLRYKEELEKRIKNVDENAAEIEIGKTFDPDDIDEKTILSKLLSTINFSQNCYFYDLPNSFSCTRL